MALESTVVQFEIGLALLASTKWIRAITPPTLVFAFPRTHFSFSVFSFHLSTFRLYIPII